MGSVADRLLGSWLVTEHVYAPEGVHLGDIRQRRTLEQLEKGRVRVTQDCSPNPALDGHPLGAMHGPFVYDLEVSGSRRRYLGPDLMGHGTEWIAGATTARCVWPRLKLAYSSWSILLGPGRQLTGGWYEIAGRPVAVTVGVGSPDPEDGTDVPHPSLDLRSQPAPPLLDGEATAISNRWGPLLVVDTWEGPDHHERRVVVTDAEVQLTATLLLSEVGGTRLGDLDVVPTG